MTSTGNDIVALKAINIARTIQFNFYSKIISAAEKDLYDQQFADKLALENFVWLLWSVKESAYKYLKRVAPELVFSPTRVNIQSLELPEQLLTVFEEHMIEGCGFDNQAAYKGVVQFGTHQLFSRSIISDGFIFSMVNGENHFANTCWGIQRIPSADSEHQSKAIREFLIGKLNGLFPDAAFKIEKSLEGIPILLKDTQETNIPVSLAHHDHWVAYSFQLESTQNNRSK